jgi:hypothetical protein
MLLLIIKDGGWIIVIKDQRKFIRTEWLENMQKDLREIKVRRR